MAEEKVTVLGAGVIGVMTAYWLSELGIDVTIVERETAAALGCSHGNAGILALGHAEAWGSPGAPLDLVSSLFGLNPALKVSHPFDPALWRWGIKFLGNCSPAAYRRNSQSLLRNCEYSATLLREAGDRENIEYFRSDLGALYLFRSERKFAARVRQIERDPDASRLLQVLDPDDIVLREPSLENVKSNLAGGLFSPGDISGDCRAFTQALARSLETSGRVKFHYGVKVDKLCTDGSRVKALLTDNGSLPCQQLVVAAGNFSPQLLLPLGIRVPIYPVKGYSATYPVVDARAVPKHAAIDETHLVSYALYGDRLRMTSIAEFAGFDSRLIPERLQLLDEFARSICAEALDYANASYWTGLRPSTPASTPYLGRIRGYDNLWINAGHGQLGWSMSAGSGKIMADLVTGEQPALSSISAKARWLEAF